MEWFLLFIPPILSGLFVGILALLKKLPESNNSGFWFTAVLGPIILGLIIIPLMSAGFKEYACSDTEYLSYYITKIRHYDEWDEWIHKTCTRKVYKGTDENGHSIYEEEEYDCSYREFHPERWSKFNNNGQEIYTTEEDFNRIKYIWGTKSIFVDMHRHYYRIDGDAQDYNWCGEWFHIETATYNHHYTNKIKGSGSVFNDRKISEEEAKELGLFNYPEPNRYEIDPNPILGIEHVSGRHIKKFQYLNAYYGLTKQIHIFVLVFPKEVGAQIIEDQKAYWGGGNKNEFIICLGLDKPAGRINWAGCFSWQDDTEMDVRCKNFLLDMKIIDLSKLADWIEQNLDMWKRKEFKDFDYIETPLTEGDIIGIMWTLIIVSILVLIGSLFIGRNLKNSYRYRY